MKRNEQGILDRATRELRVDVPDAEEISDSAERTAHLLGLDLRGDGVGGAIHNCDGVRELFAAFRVETLTPARQLLVEAHLRECGSCRRLFHEGRQGAAVNWSAPRVVTGSGHRPIGWAWAVTACAILVTAGVFVFNAYWRVPPGVRAEVQSIDGSAYLVDESGDRRLAAGAKLHEGQELRTAGGSRAVVRLADGSRMEINQRSTLAFGARGRDATVSLRRGAVILQAASRTSGHLYVRTPDCRVAVTGTVFSVDAGLKGSRVAVLQGSVHVVHDGIQSVLSPGDQIATSSNLAPEPLDRQFAWSPDREKYVGLMAELANVEHSIARIPLPQPRYSSDLLPRVPADTLLYVSIPNLGDFLNQANTIFQNQLNQSPALQQWWTHNQQRNPEALNDLVAKIHDVSTYLGDEVVLIGFGQEQHSGVALIADVQRSGLKEELEQQFSNANGKLVVLDPASLASATAVIGPGGFALVRDREVVFGNNLATLKLINAQLDAGASGFARSPFGNQIAAAYDRGAGIVIAANLHQMLQGGMAKTPQPPQQARGLEASGLGNVQYLIAEHREVNGMPANHLNLQFTGTRQRIASWLASPAPIGSLDFVSPNASLALATLTRDPGSIADDLMAIASQSKGAPVNWDEIDTKLQISVRDDLMQNLSGDFLFAIDGPVLPTPSWKLVIGVNNPAALENALERMTQAIRSQLNGPNAHAVSITAETSGSRTYYVIRDLSTGTDVAQWTFAGGYMIVAPTRALLIDSLKTHESGGSLAHSSSFRSLLPRDENENYSAVAYQNLSPVLTPLLSQFSGEYGDAIRKLASDSRPTVVCAWGKDNRIEVASDSRIFGFDFLTLGAVLDSRNKSAGQRVMN